MENDPLVPTPPVKMPKAQKKDLKPSQQQNEALFEDVGNIELEFGDSEEILHLSNTFKDKAIFMIFATLAYISCYLLGFAPKYYYIYYSVLSSVLLPYRRYFLKKINNPMPLLMFCYFGNVVTLFYLWYPSQIFGDGLRNILFPVCFSYAMGPLLFSAVIFKNSLVFHSTNHMTQTFLHLYPFFTMWGIRWYSTEDQGFYLPDDFKDSNGSYTFGLYELVILPSLIYFGWCIIYILIVEVYLKKYYSSEEWYSSVFGKKYEKVMFYFYVFVGPQSTTVVSYFFINSKILSTLLGFMVVLSVVYNGASFYVDYFSRHYYAKRVLKDK